MEIKVWGCRGSLPTPGAATLRYGGNTTCIEVRPAEGGRIIIDAGSGIRPLGKALLQEEGLTRVCLLLTHAHWDHLMGFPFFTPAYFSRFTISVCGGPRAQQSLRDYLAQQMQAPYFPVEFGAMKATFKFDCNMPTRGCRHSVDIEPFPLNHPNGGYGFKFTEGGRSFVFLTDNEISHAHPGGPDRSALLEFCRGADLLLHDAQYTDEEYGLTRGWGHSTYADAVDLAVEAGVGRFGLFHHDPDRSDDDLEAQLGWCRERIEAAGADVDCFATIEGSTLTP